MARLNTHLSATPQIGRSSTANSLYRDPTPQSQRRANASGTARESTYSVMSPTQSQSSDKENDEPESRQNTPGPASKRHLAMASRDSRLPTPGSSHSGNKRRRVGDNDRNGSAEVHEDEQDEDDQEQGQDDNGEDVGASHEDDDDEDTRYYDPNQDPDLRRQLRANIRQNQREMEDNRDELIKSGGTGISLLDHIKRQNQYMNKVKQTADAALDSRVMVYASELASKKMKNSLHGNAAVGVDVDQFVSRCIQFMRSGGNIDEGDDAVPTQARHRRRTQVDEDEDEDADEDADDQTDDLDWALFGREACFPFNKRPPVSGFLLGPLSVQRNVRATQTRRAKSQRQPTGPATRPQELQQSDIQQSENSNLTHLVKRIHNSLKSHIEEGQAKVETELQDIEDPDESQVEAAFRRQRTFQTREGELAVSLFDFVVNPHSFGQTVENLFYVSFLIREGTAGVVDDVNGLPLLTPTLPQTINEQRELNVRKNQAVFSLDWPTWKKLIEAFDIKDPLIPHRVSDAAAVTAGGWYG